jgi:hypothetical protein
LKPDCLHCQLLQATEKWLKSHHASEAEIRDMLGWFVCEAFSLRPEFKDLSVKVIVLGLEYSNDDRGRLH